MLYHTVFPLPQHPTGRDIEFVFRLERTISRLGRPQGFDGDPLAENFPGPLTEGDIHDACDLLASLPCELRNWDRRVAHKMCKAAVFGRTRDDGSPAVPSSTPEPHSPNADAKLQRERRRKRRESA